MPLEVKPLDVDAIERDHRRLCEATDPIAEAPALVEIFKRIPDLIEEIRWLRAGRAPTIKRPKALGELRVEKGGDDSLHGSGVQWVEIVTDDAALLRADKPADEGDRALCEYLVGLDRDFLLDIRIRSACAGIILMLNNGSLKVDTSTSQGSWRGALDVLAFLRDVETEITTT